MTGALASAAGPQPGYQTGIATLSWGGTSFQFRVNPNEIWWTYKLLSSTTNTLGGRVIQILGVQIGDLTVKIDCGNGGWNYLMQVVSYLRDLLTNQRNDVPATFEYTGRDWKFRVYALNIPFQDDWQATTRELTLNFKIQEDVNGVATGLALDLELQRLAAGVGANHNKYNDLNATNDPGIPGNPVPINLPPNLGGLGPLPGIITGLTGTG